MAVPAIGRAARAGLPNASAFLDLYRHERPEPARPVDEFIDELKQLVRDSTAARVPPPPRKKQRKT